MKYSKDNFYKILDFGEMKVVDLKEISLRGTIQFLSPEVLYFFYNINYLKNILIKR